MLFIATRCPRCRIDQHYLNVLVAHVLLDQCQCHSDVPLTLKFNQSLLVACSPPRTDEVGKKQEGEEPKEKQLAPVFASNGISSCKMSALDGTHAVEFTAADDDGRSRKGHLCLFCGKVTLSIIFSSKP